MTFHRHAANTRLNFCAKETDENPEIEIERSAELNEASGKARHTYVARRSPQPLQQLPER